MGNDRGWCYFAHAVIGRLERGACRCDHAVATSPDPRTSDARQVGWLRHGTTQARRRWRRQSVLSGGALSVTGQRLIAGMVELLRLQGKRYQLPLPTLEWFLQRAGARSTGLRHSLPAMSLRRIWEYTAGLIPCFCCWCFDPGSSGRLPQLRYCRPACRTTPPSSHRCGSYFRFLPHPVSAYRPRARRYHPAPAQDRRHVDCRSLHPGARCS